MTDRQTTEEAEPEEIDPAHLPAVLAGLAQIKRGNHASDTAIESAFSRSDK